MLASDSAARTSSPTSMSTTTTGNSTTDTRTSVVQSKVNIIAIGVSIAMLLILSTILIITATVLIWNYKRRSSKQVNNGSPYFTLNRRAGQPQFLQQDSAQLYDQIHLSPSTGQAEYVPKSETANINNQSQTSQNSHPTYSTAGGDITENSSTLNTVKVTTSQLSSQRAHESTSEQPTYAAVDASKKKKLKLKEDAKCKAAEKGPPVAPYAGREVPSASTQESITKQEINSPHIIEELYTAVKKPKGEKETPPIPPLHTVEELYTAVQKNPKSNSHADGNKDETTLADNTETAPPIPPHTMEELYTAVVKKPKGNEEEEKEAPPIPPYII